MKQFLKQFMGWGTDVTRRLFFSTRITLTLMYVVTTMVVIVVFSIGLFQFTTHNIRIARPPKPEIDITIRDMKQQPLLVLGEGEFPRPIFNRSDVEKEIRKQMVQEIKENIIILDVLLLFIVSVCGYILSGFALRPIEKSYTIQKKFIADASHDLRTPLAIMQSEIEVALLDKKGDHTPVLASSLEEVGHMTKLVDNLFLLAKLDQGEVLHKEPIQIDQLISKIVDSYATMFKEKGIIVAINASPFTVKGDAHKIERALRNIVHNAYMYTDSGTITISGTIQNTKYRVSIKDTGIGIKKSNISYVFDRFYKGDHSRTHTTSSGLGLSITREIIRAHGGDVQIYSQEGVGTEVIVTI